MVESIDRNTVTIKIQRDSSCGDNCTMCNACPSKNMSITLKTDLQLQVGDKVKLETNTKYILLSAFCIYILPIILFIVGYMIHTLYLGLLLMIISFTILLHIDKKINTKYIISISKVH